MLGQLHSLPALMTALFAIVLYVTGAILALNPALERWDTVISATGHMSVAELAGKLTEHYPGGPSKLCAPVQVPLLSISLVMTRLKLTA